MFIKDPKTKEPSVTLTAFITGFLVVTFKLLVAGVSVAGFTMSQFTGSDYGMAIGALGGVYVLRRHSAIDQGKSSGLPRDNNDSAT